MMENELKSCPFCGGAPNLNGPCWVDEIDQYSVTHRCGVDIYSMGVHETAESAIAAWNARAGGEGEAFAKVRYLLKGLEQFADNLQDDSGICPLCGSGPGHDDKCYIFEIRHVLAALHPTPALDAGQVERLVDEYREAVLQHHTARIRYPDTLSVTAHSNRENIARAALLEYVSKGTNNTTEKDTE